MGLSQVLCVVLRLIGSVSMRYCVIWLGDVWSVRVLCDLVGYCVLWLGVGVCVGVVYCDIYQQPVVFGTFQILSIWSDHIDKVAEFSGDELLCEIIVGMYIGVV